MEWPAWEPLYRQIARDFGYSIPEDEAAAARLDRLLDGCRQRVDVGALARRLGQKTVVVAGPAPSESLASLAEDHVVVACDAATTACVAQAVFPAVVVTDLDGDVRDQLWANDRGAIACVAAHGDNRDALERWVPEFAGPVLGTTQARPQGKLVNAGGFTDGDRACFLAAAAGARELVLTGFDFSRPAPKEGKDAEVKRRKLAWAKRLIDEFVAPRVPVRFEP
ncbi:MAG TPA: 6-hydroxymethylpterin diphosphokinase MptE-like protein [Candidatus Thermoplasmatota archaeon]|nr:6-hydroxymethylpterin diphosphokinase MptE-like protein [Candidatus Thermoplasmatota archaeon]